MRFRKPSRIRTLQSIIKQMRNSDHLKAMQGVKLLKEHSLLDELEGIDLRGADLHLVRLPNAKMENANLQQSNLRGAYLVGINLQGANLSNSNLQGALVWAANLQNTKLFGVDARGARLGCNMRSANLQQADLTWSQFANADLTHADLRGARGVSQAGLSQAYALRHAIMPDGQRYDGRFQLEGDLIAASLERLDLTDREQSARFYGVAF